MSAPLFDDPLWSRAGNWPALAAFETDAHIDLALLGVPAYRTSLSPTDAHATPSAVRDALRRYSPALMPRRSPSPSSRAEHPLDLGDLTVADAGDVHEPDGSSGEARTIATVAAALDRAELVVAIGGDNSITVATALGAWGDRLGDAGLITLDAHYDLRDGISNGSPVRRLIEAGLDGRRVVQVGIADFVNSTEYAARAADYGITVVHRDELHHRPMADVMAEALELAGSGGGPIHVDLDVDVCDRAVAPGCPASVPGGISAWELRMAARIAATDSRVRSLDIAEIDATTDAPDGRTVRLAALCVLETLAGLALR